MVAFDFAPPGFALCDGSLLAVAQNQALFSLLGTAFGGARGRTDVPKIVDWYMDGRINIDDLITHVLPFEKINEGFDLMHRGESIRSVVVY